MGFPHSGVVESQFSLHLARLAQLAPNDLVLFGVFLSMPAAQDALGKLKGYDHLLPDIRHVTLKRVWDLPTRLFHWTLVVCICGMLVTAQLGGNAMQWHFRFGYAVLVLVVFRLVWGFVGGYWSRFSVFLSSPSAALAYARTPFAKRTDSVGHNPLGAWSVLAMLLATLLQVGAGLFSDDDIGTSGPLARYASNQWVGWATHYHTGLGKFALFGLIALHVGTVVWYRVKHKHDLVRSMVHGDKLLRDDAPASVDTLSTRLFAAMVLTACACTVFWLLP